MTPVMKDLLRHLDFRGKLDEVSDDPVRLRELLASSTLPYTVPTFSGPTGLLGEFLAGERHSVVNGSWTLVISAKSPRILHREYLQLLVAASDDVVLAANLVRLEQQNVLTDPEPEGLRAHLAGWDGPQAPLAASTAAASGPSAAAPPS